MADAEPVGVHHQHDRSVGDIDANLNDRGAHQHIDLTGPESRHRSVLVVGRQPSMHERQPQLCELGGTQPGEQAFGSGRWSDAALNVGVVGLIDAGRHHIGLAAGGSLFDDAPPGAVEPGGLVLDKDDVGGNRLAPERKFAQRRGFQVAIDGQRDRARYRRRGHHQQVRGNAGGGLGAQLISLLDTKPVLLVDHHHAQVVKVDGLLQQRVRADDDADLTAGDFGANLLLLPCRHRTGEQCHPGGVFGASQLAAHGQRP